MLGCLREGEETKWLEGVAVCLRHAARCSNIADAPGWRTLAATTESLSEQNPNWPATVAAY